ncbi:putative membrane protein YhfC [Natranaerovirga hydrolytica]|uniref:Putative membrane protein YhfC n=1 Tax=Natranaerovirga hydrolytica TaxID=680378 RepID=A0A4R1MKQ1_9FIRM|nr:YhfC family glutamic-type intramembrane protease [Natranaerovirga hydrolytica]TCK92402.1 putative membrane protein YhfC [Natranaerovirga hydrolytica]
MPILTFIFIILTLFITIFVPIIALIVLKIKTKFTFKIVLIGFIAFSISQLYIRLPLLNFIDSLIWINDSNLIHMILLALFIGLSGGIIIEGTRYILFKYIIKNDCNYTNGIAYSLTYEGVQSIIILGYSYIIYLFTAIQITQGHFTRILSEQGVPIEEIENAKHYFIDNPFLFLSDGVNQLIVFAISVLLSVLTIYSIKSSQFKYFAYVVIFNTLFITIRYLLSGIYVEIFSIAATVGLFLFVRWFVKSKEIDLK